jgi:DNA-binding LacI/PurR family transcriptional regulator
MPAVATTAEPKTQGPSATTLADVAAHLGVSRTTVSNAYNRPDQLSPALRDRVLAAAADLGYAGPDPMARGLRRGRTGSLGLVFDQPLTYAFTDPAAALFLTGMAQGLEEHGAALSIIPRMPEGPRQSAELVRSALVDGYMLFCTAADDPRYGAVRGRGLPYVLIEYEDEPDGRRTAAHVQIDDIHGAEDAARHLTDLGHRRVAIVTAYGEGTRSGPEAEETARWRVLAGRLRGWRAGLERGGVDWSAVTVSSAGGSSAERGRRAAAALLDRAERPTAILALSDVLALGVLQAAAERGIDVPAELSVVGFDDIPQAAAASLTTVSQPHEEKGRAAVRLLVSGARPSDSVLLPCHLVVRASTGPAPH